MQTDRASLSPCRDSEKGKSDAYSTRKCTDSYECVRIATSDPSRPREISDGNPVERRRFLRDRKVIRAGKGGAPRFCSELTRPFLLQPTSTPRAGRQLGAVSFTFRS